MKLIVTDLDGTLLNSKNEISAENVEALTFAQRQGIEVAAATGRTYANALAVCQRAGLNVHIISNNGSFVYSKDGEMLRTVGLEVPHVKEMLHWLQKNDYCYSVCTDKHFLMPTNTSGILTSDFENAQDIDAIWNVDNVKEKIYSKILKLDGLKLVDNFDEIFEQQPTIGHIAVTSFDKDKLSKGKEYFSRYTNLSIVASENIIFDMMNTSASKGNGLEYLVKHLDIPLQDVMAIGDNYNDISMLEKVGHSVAIGNAEEAVKAVCDHISLTNDLHGVAHIVNRKLNRGDGPFDSF